MSAHTMSTDTDRAKIVYRYSQDTFLVSLSRVLVCSTDDRALAQELAALAEDGAHVGCDSCGDNEKLYRTDRGALRCVGCDCVDYESAQLAAHYAARSS